jgi:hypothetical protein
MVLLGDVRELEVERERPQDTRLPLERQGVDGIPKITVRLAGPRSAGEGPHALDVLEQGLPLLLDEDAAEQVAQEAHVAAEGVGNDGHPL